MLQTFREKIGLETISATNTAQISLEVFGYSITSNFVHINRQSRSRSAYPKKRAKAIYK